MKKTPLFSGKCGGSSRLESQCHSLTHQFPSSCGEEEEEGTLRKWGTAAGGAAPFSLLCWGASGEEDEAVKSPTCHMKKGLVDHSLWGDWTEKWRPLAARNKDEERPPGKAGAYQSWCLSTYRSCLVRKQRWRHTANEQFKSSSTNKDQNRLFFFFQFSLWSGRNSMCKLHTNTKRENSAFLVSVFDPRLLRIRPKERKRGGLSNRRSLASLWRRCWCVEKTVRHRTRAWS